MENLSKLFIKFSKRAEKVDHKSLVKSFVDVGPLFTVLSTNDNQILFGRRGTGKTHALVYLFEYIKKNGGIPVYIDLRQIGSTGGIYADPDVPFSERATRLLVDTLATIHDEIVDVALLDHSPINLGEVGPILDDMAYAINEVTVRGPVEEETLTSDTHTAGNEVGIKAYTSSKDLSFGGTFVSVQLTPSSNMFEVCY